MLKNGFFWKISLHEIGQKFVSFLRYFLGKILVDFRLNFFVQKNRKIVHKKS